MAPRIAYIGNHTPPRGTETGYAEAFERAGCEVVRYHQDAAYATGPWPWCTYVLREPRPDLVLYTRTHNRTALPTEWTYVWRKLEAEGIRTASLHLDVFVGVRRFGMDGWGDPLFTTGYVFTPDPLLAVQIASEHTAHYWLPPAADIRPGDPAGEQIAGLDGKVVFVGSRYGTPQVHPEYPMRAQLLDWLTATYGLDFYWYGPQSPLGGFRGKPLWDVYASDCVIVGDSCFAGARPYYWSDRIPETLGHGGLLLHPEVEGLADAYPLLPLYRAGDFTQLAAQIETLRNSLPARTLRKRQRADVRRDHTLDNRARTILDTLELTP